MKDQTALTVAQKRAVIEALCKLAATGVAPATLTAMREALVKEITAVNAIGVTS